MECRGCGLTAWCSEACRLEDLRAGHHLLCRQLQAVTEVYSPEVKRLTALAHDTDSPRPGHAWVQHMLIHDEPPVPSRLKVKPEAWMTAAFSHSNE